MVFLEDGEMLSKVEFRDQWPSLTVAIPAYNEEDTISDTIQSALDAEYPGERSIIVVNDGSQDNTSKEIEKYLADEEVNLIDQKNQGKGAALNTALDESETDLFACLDADSYLKNESLKNIVSELDEDQAGLASAMKVYNPRNLLQKLQWVEYLLGIFLRNIMEEINSIHVTPGPLSIYRTKLLKEVGGFDNESLVEDQEICFRFQKQDMKIGHSRKGESYTVAPATLKEFYNQRLRWYKGSIENIIKYREMIFNSKYGEFGVFAVPTKILQGLMSVIGLSIIGYYFLKPYVEFLQDFMILGSDAIQFQLSDLTISNVINGLNWMVLGMDWITVLFLSTLILFSIMIFYMSTVHTEEEPLKYGVIPPLLHMLWYFIAIGLMWAVSFVSLTADIVLGRDKRWT